MKLQLLLLIAAVCVAANAAPLATEDDLDVKWGKYKATYNKHYDNLEEDNMRKGIYKKKLKEVEENNRLYDQGLVSYKIGINMFSDMTELELAEKNGLAPIALDQKWADYKAKYGKNYPDAKEDNMRKRIFAKTLRMVETFNKLYDQGLVTWKMGINKFSDYTDAELANRFKPGVLATPENLLDQQWADYKEKYGKNYPPAEDKMRKQIFANKLKMIEEHNKLYEKGLEPFEMGLNNFSDWTEEEYKSILMNIIPRIVLNRLWAIYKAKFGKHYADVKEDNMRKGLFEKSFIEAREHNMLYDQGLVHYQIGINNFSDMTEEERDVYRNGLLHKSD